MTALIVIVITVTALALVAATAFVLVVISIQIVDHFNRLMSEPRNFLDSATRRLLGSRRCSIPRQTKES
jgi:hypothetical protein